MTAPPPSSNHTVIYIPPSPVLTPLGEGFAALIPDSQVKVSSTSVGTGSFCMHNLCFLHEQIIRKNV